MVGEERGLRCNQGDIWTELRVQFWKEMVTFIAIFVFFPPLAVGVK